MECNFNLLERINSVTSKGGIEDVFSVVGSLNDTMAIMLVDNKIRVKKKKIPPEPSLWSDLENFTYSDEEVREFMVKFSELLKIIRYRNHTIKFNDCMIYYLGNKNSFELYIIN